MTMYYNVIDTGGEEIETQSKTPEKAAEWYHVRYSEDCAYDGIDNWRIDFEIVGYDGDIETPEGHAEICRHNASASPSGYSVSMQTLSTIEMKVANV